MEGLEDEFEPMFGGLEEVEEQPETPPVVSSEISHIHLAKEQHLQGEDAFDGTHLYRTITDLRKWNQGSTMRNIKHRRPIFW